MEEGGRLLLALPLDGEGTRAGPRPSSDTHTGIPPATYLSGPVPCRSGTGACCSLGALGLGAVTLHGEVAKAPSGETERPQAQLAESEKV